MTIPLDQKKMTSLLHLDLALVKVVPQVHLVAAQVVFSNHLLNKVCLPHHKLKLVTSIEGLPSFSWLTFYPCSPPFWNFFLLDGSPELALMKETWKEPQRIVLKILQGPYLMMILMTIPLDQKHLLRPNLFRPEIIHLPAR